MSVGPYISNVVPALNISPTKSNRMETHSQTQYISKRMWVWLIVLCVVGIAIMALRPSYYAVHLNGRPDIIEGAEAIRPNLTAHLILLPLIAALLALPAAFVRHRNLSYKGKFIRFWAFILAILYGVFALRNLGIVLNAYYGWEIGL